MLPTKTFTEGRSTKFCTIFLSVSCNKIRFWYIYITVSTVSECSILCCCCCIFFFIVVLYIMININTRPNIKLHLPVCDLTVFQKGAYFSGIKLFNHLPLKLKSLSNEIKIFKTALKRFLNFHSFYSVEGYIEYSYNYVSWFLNKDKWDYIYN